MARVNPFQFTKSWRKDEGVPYFPTKESSETKVRADLQQLFNEIKSFINETLLDAVNTVDSSDVSVASGTGTMMLSDKLAEIDAALEDLDTAIEEATVGTLPDDSITGAKIQHGTLTGEHLDQGTIEQINLANGCVSTTELNDLAVTEAKLANNAVTTAKILDGSVTPAKLTPALRTTITEKYAVGDIFITTRVGNPATLLGYGTWEGIINKFLYAAGPDNPIGSTGGEAEHTLTVGEMPTHSHKVRYVGAAAGGAYGGQPGTSIDGTPGYSELIIAPEGGGAAHNNMPPYLTVSMWIRTA